MILRNEIDSLKKNLQSNARNPPYFSSAFTVILQTLLEYFLSVYDKIFIILGHKHL